MWCGDVWSCVVLCGLVWSCVVLCGLVWSCVVLCGLVWSGVVLVSRFCMVLLRVDTEVGAQTCCRQCFHTRDSTYISLPRRCLPPMARQHLRANPEMSSVRVSFKRVPRKLSPCIRLWGFGLRRSSEYTACNHILRSLVGEIPNVVSTSQI